MTGTKSLQLLALQRVSQGEWNTFSYWRVIRRLMLWLDPNTLKLILTWSLENFQYFVYGLSSIGVSDLYLEPSVRLKQIFWGSELMACDGSAACGGPKCSGSLNLCDCTLLSRLLWEPLQNSRKILTKENLWRNVSLPNLWVLQSSRQNHKTG